ncbi:IclR family transcriptional regulator [Pseudonocardia sp.]|uniref:IclR family transcriptional regulator n=1 Tax=Pseudonocardia sp. TaxID=60912 RepID=UPI00261CE901|nr:IclR family transcriptional regulator [Pseudonocardia sp.]
MAVLDAFRTSGCDVLGVTELARHTALPKTTVHRLAARLVATGMLERQGSAFRLGLRLFELGALVPRQRILRDAAQTVMADLRQSTRHTAHLAIRDGADVMYVEILYGADAPATPVHVGGRWPLHATAVGKAILAFSSRDDVDAVLRTDLARVSRRTVSAPGLLGAEMATIRRTGCAFDREESQAGLVCVASPIFDAHGVVAGLSLAGWSARMRLARAAGAVHEAAAVLSRQLDHRLPTIP